MGIDIYDKNKYAWKGGQYQRMEKTLK